MSAPPANTVRNWSSGIDAMSLSIVERTVDAEVRAWWRCVGSAIDSGVMACNFDACVLWEEGANEVTVEERQANAMQAAGVARLIFRVGSFVLWKSVVLDYFTLFA